MSQSVDQSEKLFIAIPQTTRSANTGQQVEWPVDSPGPAQHVWSGYENTETGMRAGVWQSEAGSWRVEITGYTEFCVLKEGEVVVEEDDGTRYELKAGDALVMEDGFRGVWNVAKYVRKFYFISDTPAV